MEEAIRIAIKGGWDDKDYAETNRVSGWRVDGKEYGSEVALCPLFWQALGKALGWADRVFMGEPISKKMSLWLSKREKETGEPYIEDCTTPEWKYRWHSLIDHLSEGKDAESFFQDLLK